MAISTYQIFLMKGTGTEGSITYAKLIDIKDFPTSEEAPKHLKQHFPMRHRPIFPAFRKWMLLGSRLTILIPTSRRSRILKEMKVILQCGLA